MKTHAQVVVIGGGLVGCSILYHLAKLGWTNVVLLERDELTSGSTWHAAANIHGLHDNNNITRIQHYTMNLYKELEKETGQGCGVFQPGSLYLAQTEEREHQLRLQEAKAKFYGLNFYEIDREKALELHPLAQFDDIRCIMFEPEGGNVDPSGVTMAYAAGARQMGATVERFCPVIGTEQQPDGSWIVRTKKGDIHAQWVVNAGGLWGREVAAMAGIELPLLPTEHQYFVTEAISEVADLGRRLPSIADRDGEYYFRQEGNGLLIGAYEKDMKFWAEDGTPQGFGHELFADDLDRIMENVMRAMDRVPAAATAGVKRVINGPMIWSPDSNALFGTVPELQNYFCCTGIIPGFSQSGGLGLLAAQWIIEGEPEYDMFAWDLARFGDWADKKFTKARVRDQYQHRFKIHFPNEERSAGRPARVRPAYEMQKGMGAVFGLNCGWEHPLWFADAPGAEETIGFTRQNWFEPVGREVKMLRDNVGVIDISNFANYVIKGTGAQDWLDALVANRVPSEVGRSCLTPLIGVRGGVAGDFTITKVADDKYMMVGSGMAERYHQRFFNMIELPEGTTFKVETNNIAGFNVAGPKSRSMLQRLTNADLSNFAFRFMRSKTIEVAGIECLAIRVSFTGDLGWELHCDEKDQVQLYTALLDAAREFDGGPVGGRALGSLRIEKGYGSWGREYSPEYWPQEVSLERLIKLDKDFLNKEAYLSVKDNVARERLSIFEVEITDDADASGGEPIFLPDGTPVGRVTSGAFGYSVGKSLALGYAKEGVAKPGDTVHIFILGKPHKATLLAKPPFDPDGDKLRA
ncbi:FAD-dependent oxidoreductase [Pseudohalocynthiibacter aestuariivivens]|jgi:dimethylglycine dehydrogenase|uniref:FAD-dependent oxidoreductase n=1 Tax=Pseudohalocynthiibacter aestuariivivens TaxID=1591409 RepID=A0ABV5JFD3_9RHOB|nr:MULTISPECIES: FAD-dependent oxidoreductase [Pseudohalocynthiibacter]MBS9717784.1 GcvT family protein [Pseudohalocynthiibacter aestuariivivens]MCK0103066.1 FAD-dependent oxidoreductase [Pseudohalocynthiibacter sp. F2068]